MKRAWISAVVLNCVAAALPAAALEIDPAVRKFEQQRIAVMAAARDAVLAVFGGDGGGGGSGVVISPDGYALTNFHVAQPSGNALKCGMADGKLYDAVIVGVDPTGDLALIKLLGRDDFPSARMANSDDLAVGDWVFAMGNPFLLATDFQPTVTYGIVSGIHRYQYPAGTLLEYTDCIQTDASINPGNSGGPLFDSAGRLVGINGRASFQKRGRVNVGVGYAISINQAKNFLGPLKSGRIVDHATLGARVGFDGDGRVIVTDILETCDAYRRGLRYGDEIVSFAGRPIETPNAFKNVLGIFPKGWRVPLSYRREGRRFDVLVRLQGVHGEAELLAKLERGAADPQHPDPQPGPRPKKGPPDGPGDDEKPRKGRLPLPSAKRATADDMPAIVKNVFEARRGFANYYFNKVQRDRVWKNWQSRGDLTGRAGTWNITGFVGDGTEFTLELTDAQATLKLPSTEWRWTAADPLEAALKPPGSNGLLLALNLWRRLAVLGPQRYGDVTYFGNAPLAGQAELVDVLVGDHAGVECRFYFHAVEGYLLAIEMSVGDDVDPCEITFSDYHEADGRWLPHTLMVRAGDDVFGEFKFKEFDLKKSE